MKRIFVLIAMLLLVFAFGCGKDTSEDTTEAEQPAPPSMEDVAGTPMEDTDEEPRSSAPSSGDIKVLGMRNMEPMELKVRAGAEVTFEKVGNEDRNFRIIVRTGEEKNDVAGSGEQLHGEDRIWSVVLDQPGTYYFKETNYGGSDGVIIVE